MEKKKKLIIILSSVAAACVACGAITGIVVACTQDKFTVTPSDAVYESTLGFTAPSAEMDAGIKIDGILDEGIYTQPTRRWYNGVKVDGAEKAYLDFTTHFGEKGIYIAYEVEEVDYRVYYNSDRDNVLNSQVEMYFAVGGTTQMESRGTFEVDMLASGLLRIKQRFEYTWQDASTTWDKMVVYAAKTHGGEINSEACYGYSGEMFIPYDYLVHCGVIGENEKPEEVYINPVLITSYNFEGDNTALDRNWYNTALHDTDGNGWDNPSTFLHFNKDGLVSYDINTEITGKGSVTAPKDYKFALANNSLTLNVASEGNYTLESLTINDDGIDYKQRLSYDENYNAQLVLANVTENLNIKATFKEISEQKQFVCGNIIANGVNAANGIDDMRVKLYDGFKYTDLRTVNGSFAGNVFNGEYDLVIVSANGGYEVTRKSISVNENLPALTVVVNDTMYGENRTVKIDGFTMGADGFAFGANGFKEPTLKYPIEAQKFIWRVTLGIGDTEKELPNQYVINYRWFFGSTRYDFQLVKWGDSFAFKKYTDGTQSFDLSENLKQTYKTNKRLELVFVRNYDDVTVYGVDLSGEFVKIGDIILNEQYSSSPIEKFNISMSEGANEELGVYISDSYVYQGTNDLEMLK